MGSNPDGGFPVDGMHSPQSRVVDSDSRYLHKANYGPESSGDGSMPRYRAQGGGRGSLPLQYRSRIGDSVAPEGGRNL